MCHLCLVEYPLTLSHGFSMNREHFVDAPVGVALVAAGEIPGNRDFIFFATFENHCIAFR